MTNQNKDVSNSQSFSSTVEIVNKRGLHARASAKFVKLANLFDANILVSKDNLEVLGTSIMGLLLLTAAKGEFITINATGNDAQKALEELSNLVGNKFEEEN